MRATALARAFAAQRDADAAAATPREVETKNAAAVLRWRLSPADAARLDAMLASVRAKERSE